MENRQFTDPMIDLNGRSILVTGATGSFGQSFVRSIIEKYTPSRLIIYSRDELKQHEMAQQLSPQEYPFLRYFIGDVRDRDRLVLAMRGVEYVIHAAALKHVPIAEYNPMECINTNVIGSENVVKAAIQADVKKVIALSTDKAANPINLYGASKLAADKIFVAANNLSGQDGCRFSVVRYGNVIGSRGGVLDLFRRLIKEGADELPITDERMTRFWITLKQANNFVLSCMDLMDGGEIFVPKIPSLSMVDFGRAFAPDMAQKVVGIRPGEKLHEIMIPGDDSRHTVEIDDRYIIQPAFNMWTSEHGEIENSKPVADGFSYISNENAEWFDVGEFAKLLGD
jgi:UDP-N-acetylglucosamine 4,6-dehydratase